MLVNNIFISFICSGGAVDFRIIFQPSCQIVFERRFCWLNVGSRKGLDAAFEKIVYQYQLLEAIRAGYLADLKTQRIELNVDLDEIHTVAGDLHQGELDEVLLKANIAKAVANAYVKHASNRKAIVFTVSVDQAKRTAAELRVRGIKAEWLSGAIPSEERKAILHRLKTGETMVLCNCAVLTEGFDEPSVDAVIIARPTKSRPLYIQMVGRGTRKAPGKTDCLVLDVTGVSKRHQLISAPSLFGLEKVEKKETITEAVERQEARNREISRLQSIFAQDEAKEFRRHIRWLEATPGVFALAAGDVGTTMIYQVADGWFAKVIKKNGRQEFLTQHPVWMELAQGIAEDYVRRADALGLIKKNATWRDEKASEKQMWALARWGIRPGRWLSKGEATEPCGRK